MQRNLRAANRRLAVDSGADLASQAAQSQSGLPMAAPLRASAILTGQVAAVTGAPTHAPARPKTVTTTPKTATTG
jgi:hypothetical protein